MTGFLSVPGFEKWQHYKDRTPPWIKLHRDLLRDYDFSQLSDATKAHLMLIWLLASQVDNRIPNDVAFIQRMTGAIGKPDIKLLIELKFLVLDAPCEQAASNSPADCTPLSNVRETEAETEEESPPEARVLTLMPFATIPAEWLQGCMQERAWPENIVLDVWENFRAYWQDGNGKKTKRADWAASWRTWYRKENIKTGGQHGSTSHQHSNQKRGGDPASNAYHAAQSIIARRNAAAGISPGAEPAHHAAAADLRLPEDLRRQGGDDGIPGRDVSGDPR